MTLNPADNLDGGGGTDSLVLYGSGTFDLNSLAGYAGIEQVQLVNFTGSMCAPFPEKRHHERGRHHRQRASQIVLQGTAAATSIQGGDGYNQVYFDGTGTATSVQTGASDDGIYFATVESWNPSITIDGGSGSFDDLYLYPSNTTLDLQPATLTGVERLYLTGSNLTALIDADTLTGVTSIFRKFGQQARHRRLGAGPHGEVCSTATVESTNATGTTFTVSDSGTAFQVFGGPGSDTLQTTSFAFTAAQRDAIFATSSIETIIDTSDSYPAPSPDPGIFKLTAGADSPPSTAADLTINGSAVTLNPADNLDGGGGTDSLVLYGSGIFDLNSLAGYAGIEQVQLVNFTGSIANLNS